MKLIFMVAKLAQRFHFKQRLILTTIDNQQLCDNANGIHFSLHIFKEIKAH